MATTPNNKDKALEALDFIINVLKEHEQVLDKSIQELATVTEQIGDLDEAYGKVEQLDKKISALQKQITNLTSILADPPKEDPPAKPQLPASIAAGVLAQIPSAPKMVLQVKEWSDFQTLAINSQTITFNLKQPQQQLEACALKDNQIITYVGAVPNQSVLLKIWLSKMLGVVEGNVLEGVLGRIS